MSEGAKDNHDHLVHPVDDEQLDSIISELNEKR